MTDLHPHQVARFWSKVDKSDLSCWAWTGRLGDSGYGEFDANGRHRTTHRIAYELFFGTIPEGMQLDHLCHSQDSTCGGGTSCEHRRCVNPEHLEPVTSRVNTLRREQFVPADFPESQCLYGHPYEGNSFIRADGSVRCKTCHRNNTRRYRERKHKEAAGK